MGVFLEIWTRPGDATFGRLIDGLPVSSMSIHATMNGEGDGSARVPNSFDRFDEILLIDGASSERSLARLFSESDPTTPIFEWLPSAILPTSAKADFEADISGRGFASILRDAVTMEFDWDGSDDFVSLDPDWQFGASNDLIQNGTFELGATPNGGFELGNTDYWTTTTDNGGAFDDVTSFGAVEDAAVARSGDWYGACNPIASYSGVRRSFSNLTPGVTYSIVGYLREPANSGLRYLAGVTGASSASHANAFEADGYWWAELSNDPMGTGSSTNTWQPFTLTFVANTDTVQLVVVYADAGNGPIFYVDDWAASGEGMGLAPWFPNAIYGTVDRMEISNAQAHSGSSSMLMQVTDELDPRFNDYANARISQIVQLTVGKTYTARAWMRQDSGSAERLYFIVRRNGRVGGAQDSGAYWMAYQSQLVSSGVWTLFEFTFVSDFAEVFVEFSWRDTPAAAAQSPVFYADDVALFEGLPATSVGEILTLLYEPYIDAALRNPIVWDDGTGSPYLTLDFDEDLDSAGEAWFETEISVKIWLRMTLLDVLEQLSGSYDIEWRVVPDDVEAGTWLLQVYNPGGMQTDYTTAAAPAIQGGSSDVVRQIRRILPSGTELMVEGLGRVTARDRNSDLVTALGRMESARLDRELPSLQAAAEAVFADASNVERTGKTYSYTLVDPQDEPLTDYLIGDALTIHDPPEVSDEARLVDVTATFTPNRAEWTVIFEPRTASGS